jgi:hypothetical protein
MVGRISYLGSSGSSVGSLVYSSSDPGANYVPTLRQHLPPAKYPKLVATGSILPKVASVTLNQGGGMWNNGYSPYVGISDTLQYAVLWRGYVVAVAVDSPGGTYDPVITFMPVRDAESSTTGGIQVWQTGLGLGGGLHGISLVNDKLLVCHNSRVYVCTDPAKYNMGYIIGSYITANVAPSRIVYGNGVYVGMETSIYTNGGDFATWTSRTIPSQTGNLSALHFDAAGSRFVLLSDAREIWTSPDGVTWTKLSVSGMGSSTVLRLATDGNGNWIAYRSTLSPIFKSTDLINWTSCTHPATNYFKQLVGSAGVFISSSEDDGSGTSDRVHYSTDGGATWNAVIATTQMTFVGQGHPQGIVADGHLAVVFWLATDNTTPYQSHIRLYSAAPEYDAVTFAGTTYQRYMKVS